MYVCAVALLLFSVPAAECNCWSIIFLKVPQLAESFQVVLTNASGEAQLGIYTEATLVVRNYNYGIYFNG